MRRPCPDCDFTVVEGGLSLRLLVIGASGLSAAERAAAESLPADITVELTANPMHTDLAALCRHQGCTIAETAVIATRPQDLPLVLEARRAFALAGAGYENEAAADRVFRTRAAGGLVQAIRYVGACSANR